MDRQEYREIISEIKNSYKNKDYERVIMFAQELPLKKIKENNVLEIVAAAYDQVGKTSLARNTLELAYRRMPNGKQTAYKMAMLSLKLNDIESAVRYYEEFCKIAPNDNQKYVLKYEIATEGGLSLYDRIRILEEYTSKETDDKWMYELARLYHEAGMGDQCAQMCDDIVVWFSDGDYLKRALELKFAHKALTPTQQAMYERIMQEYIEDYEEPEPEPEETYEEFEEDAEEFANDFLGTEKSPLDGDTKPIGLTKEEIEAAAAEAETEDAADAEGDAPEAAEEKKTINVTTTKGEPAGDLIAEVASIIAKNGIAAPRQDRKNIFYDFKLELSEPLRPIAKPEEVSAPAEDAGEEEAAQETVDTEALLHEEVSEQAAQISERLFAGEEEIPELNAEPEAMAYDPSEETPVQVPELEEEFERKKLEVNEGEVGINLDILGGQETEIDGQLSIDQLFQTYANNIENNVENRDAVARVEAERLKQIREAVESTMPALNLDDFDDISAEDIPEEDIPAEDVKTAQPAASGRAVKVAVEENTVSFSRQETAAYIEPEDNSDQVLKDTVIFNKEELRALESGELKVPSAGSEETAADKDVFRIEDEPELAYEDPVEKILREFEEQEQAKELARKEEIKAMEEQAGKVKEKEIEIPDFLKDLQFSDTEDEDLEKELELLNEEAGEESISEAHHVEAEAEEMSAPVKSEDDLFDEIMSEVSAAEAVAAAASVPEAVTEDFAAAEKTDVEDVKLFKTEIKEKVIKSEEEIDDELDDLGDFLADSMGRDEADQADDEAPQTDSAETPEAEAENDAEPKKSFELTEGQEMELDDLGDVLADIFGDELEDAAGAVEETAETAAEVVEETAEEAGEAVVEAADAVEETAETAAEVVEETAETAAEIVEETAEEAGEAVAEQAEEATEAAAGDAAEVVEETAEEVKEAEEKTEETAETVEETVESSSEETVTETVEEIEAAEEENAEEAETEDAAEETTGTEDDTEKVVEAVAEEVEAKLAEAVGAVAGVKAAEATVEAVEEAAAEAEETAEAAEEAVEAAGETAEEAAETVTETAEVVEEAAEETTEAAETETDETADSVQMDDFDLEAIIEEASEETQEQLSDVSGDTQPLERIHPFVMPREMREELAEFLLIDGMDETITKVINDIIINKRSGDATGGHLIVTGDKKIGKTFLTISIIKAINNELSSGSGKVAKVQSDSLNGKDVAKVFQKIAGNDLIIENVGDLEEQTIREILEVMQDGSVNDMVVFEGNMLAVETILNNHPEVKSLFKNRLDVSELTISQWADVACDYAKRKGYRVGDMALLALHAKIDEINMPTTRFGYEDIVNIMEAAIERCEKRNTGKLFSAFSKKDSEEIELNESDFI